MKSSALLAAFALLALSACGGGGGSDAPAPTPSFSVQVTSGNGGRVSPSSSTVTQGQTATFTISTDTGYEIASVTGCGGSLSGTTYRTGPINTNCTITASFNRLSYAVSATAGVGGSISPALLNVLHGDTATFDVTTNTGFNLVSVSGCGGTLAGNRYTTAPITVACAVTANFAQAAFTLSATAVGGGSILPTSIVVAPGGRAEFTLQPNSGFRFKQLDGCNGYFVDNKFVVESVTADCSIVAQFNNAEQVEFADPQLAQVVRNALGLASDTPISATSLAQLTTLNAAARNITRLDGLQYATGLESLDISSNQISQLSVLNLLPQQAPTKLLTLLLGNNPASQLPDLTKFTELRSLSLANLELVALPALTGLSQLNSLNANSNQLIDITQLAGLPITELFLSNNPLPDHAFSVLTSLPLRTLYVDDTSFSSAEFIAQLNSLVNFSANYTLLSDLTPLQALTNLRMLSAFGTQIFDIQPLLSLFPNNNGAIYLGGCLKTQGFARAPSVIAELKQRGNFVQVYNWAVPYEAGCLSGQDVIKDVNVTARMDASGLDLNWSLLSTDQGPWRCELHVNLAQQQPRVPVAVLDDCHLTREWLVPEINLDRVEPHLVIDNGLFRTALRVDVGEVINTAGLPDPYVHSTEWLQVVVKNNPYLIPNREAKMRLHVLSATSKTPPTVQAWVLDGGIRTPLQVTTPTRLPAQKQAENLAEGYLITLPTQFAKAGIRVAYAIAEQAERILEPQFAKVNSIDLTVVPFQLGEEVTTLPANSVIENSILTVWPFANVAITNRAPYRLSAAPDKNTNSTMLGELFDLRVAEGGRSFYYGYYKSSMNTDEFGGMAYMPGTSGVGMLPSGQIDYILSHELGHNLNLRHAPCGDPSGVDPSFPYTNASIGTVGVSLSFNTLLSPAIYRDVMSYCGNEHVSDYNLELVQDYITAQVNSPALHLRMAEESAASMLASATSMSLTGLSQQAIFYRLALSESGMPRVLQAMQITQLPELTASSRYRILAEYSQGAPLPLPVERLVFGHGDSPEQISFAVPLTSSGGQLLAWSLFDGQRLLHHEQMPQASANATNTLAASGIRVTEQAGQVCVVIPNQADGVNLLLQHQNQTMVMALNETAGQFCRDTSNIPSGGSWQVQTRRGLAVQSHSFPR